MDAPYYTSVLNPKADRRRLHEEAVENLDGDVDHPAIEDDAKDEDVEEELIRELELLIEEASPEFDLASDPPPAGVPPVCVAPSASEEEDDLVALEMPVDPEPPYRRWSSG
jgi:hypothetical protein